MNPWTANYQIAIGQIRESLGLPPRATCSEVVAKVRELVAASAPVAAASRRKPPEPEPEPRETRGTRDHRIPL